MGTIDLTVKENDTRDWEITLSDADNNALNLTGARVWFSLRPSQWSTGVYFERDTQGTGSDFITISSPASDGVITITPTTSDWSEISDAWGVYLGECKVYDASSDYVITRTLRVKLQESIVG